MIFVRWLFDTLFLLFVAVFAVVLILGFGFVAWCLWQIGVALFSILFGTSA